jgi:uncharacterized protein YdaU (DUF1376 family)
VNYYPFHIGDYAAHTGHLEPMEDLAYRRLLDTYYLAEGPLPADPAECARKVRMREYVDTVASVLREFFVPTDDGWRHIRCDEEIGRKQDKTEKAKASAERRWNSNANPPAERADSERNANAMRTHSEGNAPNSQEPIAKREKKETRAPAAALVVPEDVPEELWSDWLRVRKAKRSGAVTETALAGIRREAERAGLSLSDAIRVCCERSWVGFNAEWMRPAGNGPPAAIVPARPEWQRDTASMLAKAEQIGLRVNGDWTSEELRWHILQRLRSPKAA